MADIPMSEINYQKAHIHQDNGSTAVVVVSVFGLIALCCLALRIYSRLTNKKNVNMGLDDYLMIVGAVFTLIQVVTVYEFVHWGIGKHEIAVSPQNFAPIGKWTVVNYFTYPTAIAFVKFSILVLITRIFTWNEPLIKWGTIILLIYTFLWWIGTILAVSLGCQPFSSQWSLTSPCEQPYVTTLTTTILDIVSDLAIVLLPQPFIWRLNMSVGNRLAVGLLLALGIFCTITGIVRVIVTHSINPYDVTYQTVQIIFVVLEPIMGIIAGCIPTIHKPVRQAFMVARDIVSLVSSRSSTKSRGSSRNRETYSGNATTSGKGTGQEPSENWKDSLADVELQDLEANPPRQL